MNGERSLPVVFSSDPAAIAAAEAVKARIQSAYQMALYKPRKFEEARHNILEACKRPSFAKDVEFDRIQGKKKNPETGKWEDNHIQGLSIRFAEVALTAWGNALSETQTIFEDDNIRRVRVSVTDLENNTCFSHDIQISKTVERSNKKGREVIGERLNTYGDTVYIVKTTDAEMQNKENALVSKTVRNEGLRLIPEDIKTEARETARKTILDKITKDPQAAKKAILDSFSTIGVKPKDLEEYLKHSLDTISPKELQELRLIYKAIHDGESTWNEYVFEDEDAEAEVKKKLAELKKRQAEEANAAAGQEQGGGGISSSHGEPPSLRDEFINLRGAGYSTWIYKNKDRVESAPLEIQAEAKKKWEGIYPNDPWPLDEKAKTEDNPLKPETDPLKTKLKCPENSPTYGDEMHILYCRKACGWPEKSTQCQPFIDAGEDVAF